MRLRIPKVFDKGGSKGMKISKFFDQDRYRQSWIRLFQSGANIKIDKQNLVNAQRDSPKNDQNQKISRQYEHDAVERWESADDISSLDDGLSISHSFKGGKSRTDHRRKSNSNMEHQRQRKSSLTSFEEQKDSRDNIDFDPSEFLTKEELFDLPAKNLRSRCNAVGLHAKNVIHKKDLVELLFSYYEKNLESSSSNYNEPANIPHGQSFSNLMDEEEEMRNLLQEILPFYGQGDAASDDIVRETIEKLPLDALELPDNFGNSILILTCQYAAYDLVPLLIHKGCNVNTRNNDGACCLHFTCYAETLSIETVELLIRNGAKAEVVEKQYGCTPLHWAAAAGNTYLCGLLIDAKAQLTTIDANRCNPIDYAKQAGSDDCVRFLMNEELKKTAVQKSRKDPVYSFDFDQRSEVEQNDTCFSELISEGEDVFGEHKSTSSFSSSVHQSQSSICSDYNAENHPNYLNRTQKHKMSLFSSFDEPDSDESSEAGLAREENDNFPLSDHDRLDNDKCKEKISQDDTVDIDNLSEPRVSSHKRLNESQCKRSRHTTRVGRSKTRNKARKKQVHAHSERYISLDESKSADNISSSVTKETFEERLVSLQQKMEQQLVEQLSLLENKISSSRRPQTPGIQHLTSNEQKNVAELGTRIIHLQNEISSKDVEILALKREIVTLEGKLASNVGHKSAPSTPSSTPHESHSIAKELVSELEEELSVKEEKLQNVEKKNADLQASLNTLERQLAVFEEKYGRLQDQLKVSDEALSRERAEKDETMSLLQQTRQGIEVDAQVTKSLEDARARDKTEILRLQQELKETEENSNTNLTSLTEELQKKESVWLVEKSKFASLKDNMERMQQKHDAENNALKVQHEKSISSVLGQLDEEREIVQNLQNELKEERLDKMQKDIDRSEAIKQMNMFSERASGAESELKEMKSMIEEAKGLFANNEKLNRALHVETERRKNLHNKLEDMKGKIRVYVRIRPLSSKEINQGCNEALLKEEQRLCSLTPDLEKVNSETKQWEFDQIFAGSNGDGNSQEAVFKDTRLLVTSAIDGFNVCIFAYGQTGSGKTYTMFGAGGLVEGTQSDGSISSDAGLAPRAAAELFRVLKEKEAQCNIKVTVTMFELYNDSLRDLLAKKSLTSEKLRIKLAQHSESGMVEVDGAISESANNLDDLLHLFQRGSECRTTSSTNMNADSSRSHLITSIVTSTVNKRTGHTVRGKLTLVDLAGSERVGKSGAQGTQLKEAQSINKSLSALGDVICSLTSGKSGHVPYRNHPLTMLMSDSIGGDAKTLMFVCCSPADYNRSESGNSLDFAKRCKDVKNNVSAGDAAKIKALRSELARMKKQEKVGIKSKRTGLVRPGQY